MTAEFQLDFFEDEAPDFRGIREEFNKVKESAEKVRKGLFARHNELAKMYVEAHQRLEILEKHICGK